ncbi:MAG: hypothetical protein SGJ11_00365 [Phycisphaerae bacterium]|nr:hypothetical protein [Phycisphaerae bacterium]
MVLAVLGAVSIIAVGILSRVWEFGPGYDPTTPKHRERLAEISQSSAPLITRLADFAFTHGRVPTSLNEVPSLDELIDLVLSDADRFVIDPSGDPSDI